MNDTTSYWRLGILVGIPSLIGIVTLGPIKFLAAAAVFSVWGVMLIKELARVFPQSNDDENN